MHTLSSAIKQKALELGFVRCGFARAEELATEGARLRQWLGHGRHATMAWMDRDVEKRVDPRRALPGARTVVCVAMNYYTPSQHSADPATAKISRYAWGDDYHIVISKRLELLRDFILEQSPTAAARCYVDTGPVMDKAWAVRAGIGWLGKHTNVISREVGSWIFLGEILLDVELPPDEPVADLCGTCTACLDACPTKAIVEPYAVDSNLCISYLTIEHRGELPEQLKGKLDGWLFGCDVCQDVCPWNRFEQPTTEAAFHPREGFTSPKVAEIATISKLEFDSRFRKSPVKRAKLEGLSRNARALLRATDESNLSQ